MHHATLALIAISHLMRNMSE